MQNKLSLSIVVLLTFVLELKNLGLNIYTRRSNCGTKLMKLKGVKVAFWKLLMKNVTMPILKQRQRKKMWMENRLKEKHYKIKQRILKTLKMVKLKKNWFSRKTSQLHPNIFQLEGIDFRSGSNFQKRAQRHYQTLLQDRSLMSV